MAAPDDDVTDWSARPGPARVLRRAREMCGAYGNWPVACADRLGVLPTRPVTFRVTTPEVSLELYAETNGQDVRAINEIVFGGLYLRHAGCRGAAGATVVDLGANRGFFAAWVAQVLSVRALVCVEPDPTNLRFLRENLQRCPAGSLRVVEAAVTPEPQAHVVLHQASSPLLHTTVPPCTAAAHGVDDGRYRGTSTTVAAVSIDEVLRSTIAAHGGVDLLKIDTEGTELELLAAADPALLASVQAVAAETTDDRSSAVEAKLRAAGFTVVLEPGFLYATRA